MKIIREFLHEAIDQGIFLTSFCTAWILGVIFCIISNISPSEIIRILVFFCVGSVALYGILYALSCMIGNSDNNRADSEVFYGVIDVNMRRSTTIEIEHGDSNTADDHEWTAEKINRLMREGKIRIDIPEESSNDK